jgi:hypothetical protein
VVLHGLEGQDGAGLCLGISLQQWDAVTPLELIPHLAPDLPGGRSDPDTNGMIAVIRSFRLLNDGGDQWANWVDDGRLVLTSALPIRRCAEPARQ